MISFANIKLTIKLMKSITLSIILSLLFLMSCGCGNLPFTGTKYCSASGRRNFKIEISRTGNTKITWFDKDTSEVDYEGKFGNGSQIITCCGLNIRKNFVVYDYDGYIDTLEYMQMPDLRGKE